MITADRTNFKDMIAQGVCVVEMSAPWCPDCRRIEPIMNQLESKYPDVKFILLDFDTNEELKVELNIRRIPTLLFYKNGKEVGERLVEPDSITPIQNAIESIK